MDFLNKKSNSSPIFLRPYFYFLTIRITLLQSKLLFLSSPLLPSSPFLLLFLSSLLLPSSPFLLLLLLLLLFLSSLLLPSSPFLLLLLLPTSVHCPIPSKSLGLGSKSGINGSILGTKPKCTPCVQRLAAEDFLTHMEFAKSIGNSIMD